MHGVFERRSGTYPDGSERMNPLIDEFFKRDLTEAEAQALENLLEGSSGDAARFGEKLRGQYLALGLPDPLSLSHSAPMGSLGLLKAGLGALLIAGLGAMTWTFWPRPAEVSLASAPPAAVVAVPKLKIHPLP